MDTQKPLNKITQTGYSYKQLADELNITIKTLSSKINGKTPFVLNEVQILCELLKISQKEEKERIFFDYSILN